MIIKRENMKILLNGPSSHKIEMKFIDFSKDVALDMKFLNPTYVVKVYLDKEWIVKCN